MLWSHGRGIRTQFAWKGESQGVSRVVQAVWVTSRCHGDLREPLMLSLGSQESFRVVRSLSGFLSSWCGQLGPPLELRRVLPLSLFVLYKQKKKKKITNIDGYFPVFVASSSIYIYIYFHFRVPELFIMFRSSILIIFIYI